MILSKVKQDAQIKADLSGENQVVYSYLTTGVEWCTLAYDYTSAHYYTFRRNWMTPLPISIITVKSNKKSEKK